MSGWKRRSLMIEALALLLGICLCACSPASSQPGETPSDSSEGVGTEFFREVKLDTQDSLFSLANAGEEDLILWGQNDVWHIDVNDSDAVTKIVSFRDTFPYTMCCDPECETILFSQKSLRDRTGRLTCMDHNGKVIWDKTTDTVITSVSNFGEGWLCCDSQTVYQLDDNGEVLFQCPLPEGDYLTTYSLIDMKDGKLYLERWQQSADYLSTAMSYVVADMEGTVLSEKKPEISGVSCVIQLEGDTSYYLGRPDESGMLAVYRMSKTLEEELIGTFQPVQGLVLTPSAALVEDEQISIFASATDQELEPAGNYLIVLDKEYQFLRAEELSIPAEERVLDAKRNERGEMFLYTTGNRWDSDLTREGVLRVYRFHS